MQKTDLMYWKYPVLLIDYDNYNILMKKYVILTFSIEFLFKYTW